MIRHQIKHSKDLLQYRCNQCPYRFAEKIFLDAHIAVAHREDTATPVNMVNAPEFEQEGALVKMVDVVSKVVPENNLMPGSVTMVSPTKQLMKKRKNSLGDSHLTGTMQLPVTSPEQNDKKPDISTAATLLVTNADPNSGLGGDISGDTTDDIIAGFDSVDEIKKNVDETQDQKPEISDTIAAVGNEASSSLDKEQLDKGTIVLRPNTPFDNGESEVDVIQVSTNFDTGIAINEIPKASNCVSAKCSQESSFGAQQGKVE